MAGDLGGEIGKVCQFPLPNRRFSKVSGFPARILGGVTFAITANRNAAESVKVSKTARFPRLGGPECGPSAVDQTEIGR